MAINDSSRNYFLTDLVSLLKEKLVESSQEVESSSSESDKLFNGGKLIGYYDVITLIKSQLIAFDIDPEEIGFANFNPDLYLK